MHHGHQLHRPGTAVQLALIARKPLEMELGMFPGVLLIGHPGEAA